MLVLAPYDKTCERRKHCVLRAMGGMLKAGSGYEFADPTVVDAKTKEAIERDAGIKLDQVNPELLAFVVDRSRKAGNEAFKKKDYNKSVELYCQAIAGNPNDFSLFGNRSAAYLALGRPKDAVIDASKSIILSKKQGKTGRNKQVVYATTGKEGDGPFSLDLHWLAFSVTFLFFFS